MEVQNPCEFLNFFFFGAGGGRKEEIQGKKVINTIMNIIPT